MNSMKKSLIALCGVFAYVGVASADEHMYLEYVDSYVKPSNGNTVRGHFRPSEELLTQADLLDAQSDLDAGFAYNFTQADLNAFQSDLDAAASHTQSANVIGTASQTIHLTATQEEIFVAQLTVDNGVLIGVTQEQFDDAQLTVDKGVFDAVTQLHINDKQTYLDSVLKKKSSVVGLVKADETMFSAIDSYVAAYEEFVDVTVPRGELAEEATSEKIWESIVVSSTWTAAESTGDSDGKNVIVYDPDDGDLLEEMRLAADKTNLTDTSSISNGLGAGNTTITTGEARVWLLNYYSRLAVKNRAFVDGGIESGYQINELVSAQILFDKGVIEVVTPAQVVAKQAFVMKGLSFERSSDENADTAASENEGLMTDALGRIDVARTVLDDGLTGKYTLDEIVDALKITDPAIGVYEWNSDAMAQRIVKEGLVRDGEGNATAGDGNGGAVAQLVQAQSDIDKEIAAGYTLEEILAANAVVEVTVAQSVTQEQVDAAAVIVNAGLTNASTMEELLTAQAIIDGGLVDGVTEDQVSDAQAILDAGTSTPEDLAAAQAIVDAGEIEKVDQGDLAAAQAIIDASLKDGVDLAEVVAAQAIVDGGVSDGVTQADVEAAQAILDLGLDGVTQADVEAAQAILDGVEVLSDEEIAVDLKVAEIKQELQDLGIVANVDTPEGEARVKALVKSDLVDAAKAFGPAKAGKMNPVVVAAEKVRDGEMTLGDVNTKLSADVGSVTSSATAGSSVVSSAVGGHQANVVASSGKYGLKKYSSFKLGDTGVSSGGESRSGGVWLKAFGSDSEMKMRDSVAGYDAGTHGVVIGADTTIGNDAVVGFAFSFADIDVTGKSVANAQTDTDQYQGTLYGTLFMDDYFVNGSLAYASSSSDTSRSGLEGTLKGSYDTEIYSASVGAGMPMDMDGYAIIPQVTMAYSSISPDSYTEEGNGALKIDVESMDTFGIQAGVTLMTNIDLGDASFIPKLRLIADWDVLQEKAQVNSSWASTGTTITPTFGAEPAALGGIVGAGFDYATDDGTYVLSLDYDLSTRSDFVSHAGSVKARINF